MQLLQIELFIARAVAAASLVRPEQVRWNGVWQLLQVRGLILLATVFVVVVEASAPKVYPRVTLASASTFSESVVRTLRGGEGLSAMFC